MNETLKSELCNYLGELMFEQETVFDWIENDKILAKINAVNVLLDIDSHSQTWYEKLAKELKRYP
jgi:hypothetical protein